MARERFLAPARRGLDARVFDHPIFFACTAWRDLLTATDWPTIETLDARLQGDAGVRFASQDEALLRDGLHYESRIHAERTVATRSDNWHDLFNALIWALYAPIKRALNTRQVAEIAMHGPRQRSRAQCALTHFDEAGAVVWAAEPALLEPWDAHDWRGFFGQRDAFASGALRVHIFGHALLEHALIPDRLPTAKCLALCGGDPQAWQTRLAEAITAAQLLTDPQELRPLPLAGIPGWASGQDAPGFFDGECFRPLRPGRRYPPPATIIRPTRIEPVDMCERGSTSEPTASMPSSISLRLPAMVTSSTGQAISPPSTQKPAAPRE